MPDFEGNVAVEQLVGEHSYAPDVHLAVVVLLLDYFGGSVDGSAALGVSEEGRVDSPTEVTYLDCILVQKHVLGFNIPMQNVEFVHILHSRTYLLHVFLHSFLIHRASLQLLVQVTLKAGL